MKTDKNEQIVLGGGCFWCLDAAYKLIWGVEKVEQGYAGGTTPHPTYAQVCTGKTGHAEVVRVTFNPSQIILDDILDVFWTIHDPTTLNRQNYDVGTEYRSIILYTNEKQKVATKKSKKKAQAAWDDPIVTEIRPLTQFYRAENYHDDYEITRPDYCQVVINPKLSELRLKFTRLLK